MEAIIDTGFTDRLTLPPDIVEEMGLPLRGSVEVILADGGIETLPMYRVRLIWHGRERAIRAYAAAGDPLVGMSMLSGNELRIRAKGGGTVEIEELPQRITAETPLTPASSSQREAPPSCLASHPASMSERTAAMALCSSRLSQCKIPVPPG